MKNIKVLGIDLAKNVFQIHATDHRGRCIMRKRIRREKLLPFIANIPKCIIGIEASIGAHYWGRCFSIYGHDIRMMAPQFVKPYIKSNKNDLNDASGIAEACTRPDMRFVSVKKIAQQDILLLHRARELAVKNKIAQANQLRGLLAEYGIFILKGINQLKQLPIILEMNADKITEMSRNIFISLHKELNHYIKQVDFYTKQIEKIANKDIACKELMKIEGIGPLGASAAVATISDANSFKNGRALSAWLGLVPRQHSSGDKIRLGNISKRGDCYLRKLLIQGARSVVKVCNSKQDKRSTWLTNLKAQKGFNKTSVALANKNARIIWALLKTGECYRAQTNI